MVTSRVNKLVPALLPVAFVVAALAACGGGTEATPAKERLCTPGNYVFCRCQNRDEGSKLCSEDGTSFGKCEPCETTDNPEVYDPEPWEPLPDAGPPPVTARCGDAVVQPGEACDDGNASDGDGCDRACKLAGTDPAASRACPGMPVHVWDATPVSYTGSTTGAPLAFTVGPACPSAQGNAPTTGAAGPERVFAVTARKTGVLEVTTSDASFDTFLFAQGACTPGEPTSPAPYLACANKNAPSATAGEKLELPVEADRTYTVVVDGAGTLNNTGTFRVTFAIR